MVKGVLWDNTRSFFLAVLLIITIVELNISLLKMERTSSSVSSFSRLDHWRVCEQKRQYIEWVSGLTLSGLGQGVQLAIR